MKNEPCVIPHYHNKNILTCIIFLAPLFMEWYNLDCGTAQMRGEGVGC